MSVLAAVALREHGDVVTPVEAVLDDFSHACVQSRVLVHGNAADVGEHPAENGRLPEACLGKECGICHGMPDDIRVHETLVVCDDDESLFLGNVFGAFDGNRDVEHLEDEFSKAVAANRCAVFPVSTEAAVECIYDSGCEHNGKDDEII